MEPRLIDLSHPLDPATPPWPGNPSMKVTTRQTLDSAPSNVTSFELCNHTGTHMDAPTHFCADVREIHQVPLEQCVGPCTFLKLPQCEPNTAITVDHVRSIESSLQQTRKLVVHTGWSTHWSNPDLYFHHYPYVSEEAAHWLLDRRLELFGFDSPAVDYPPCPVHHLWLGAEAVIVENLTNLHLIGQDEFELSVIPLPLTELEASPVRAIARVS